MFKSKLPYSPREKVSYADTSSAPAAIGIAIIPMAIVHMFLVEGSGWPAWVPWLIPIALLWWNLSAAANSFNELAHQWNHKIELEEAAERASASEEA
ncbi:hypothetical protein [Streptomyces yangpuensis]|uniref:hypothetical protein n=1 Tax=Streptomyces yangpuensis TaxID=1648182 RepID=UPI0034417F88